MRRKEKLDYAKIAALELELYGEAFTVVPKRVKDDTEALDAFWTSNREAVPRCLNCGDKSMWDHSAWRCRSGCTV